VKGTVGPSDDAHSSLWVVQITSGAQTLSWLCEITIAPINEAKPALSLTAFWKLQRKSIFLFSHTLAPLSLHTLPSLLPRIDLGQLFKKLQRAVAVAHMKVNAIYKSHCLNISFCVALCDLLTINGLTHW
jgi:hypothetical protein